MYVHSTRNGMPSSQFVLDVVYGIVNRLGHLRVGWLIPAQVDTQNDEYGYGEHQRENEPQDTATTVW